jgi:two-component system OmpR family response regulator
MAPKRILVVDDDPNILQLMEIMLTRADFQVVRALGGDLGLRRFQDDSPDLAIIDIAMPGIDGYELIERIRKAENDTAESEAKRLPIIILSAHEQNVMRDYADELGVDLYLIKPVKPADLLEHIETLLA